MISHPLDLDDSIRRVFAGLSPLLTPLSKRLGLPVEAVIEVYVVTKMASHAVIDPATATRYTPTNLQARLTSIEQRYQISVKDMRCMVDAVGSIVAGNRHDMTKLIVSGAPIVGAAHRAVRARRPSRTRRR